MTKIFLAITEADLIRDFSIKTKLKLYVLVSFLYLSGQTTKFVNDYKKFIKELYLDSSAFTANLNKGKHELLSPYSKYNAKFGNKFTRIFTLDHNFDDPEHNYNNQQYLEEHMKPNGQRPIPAIHNEDDPLGEIETYVNDGHDYIAIGSNWKKVGDIYDEIKQKYPDLKIHFFGNLNRKVLKKCKPDSADSAAYAHQAKNGILNYWDPDEDKERLIHFGKYDLRPKSKTIFHYKDFAKENKKFEEFLDKKFGYTLNDILNDRVACQIVNLYFYTQLEAHLNAS